MCPPCAYPLTPPRTPNRASPGTRCQERITFVAMQDISNACAHLTKLGESLTADLTDSDLASQSTPNGKTAGWLVGHLCITGDFIRRKSGGAPLTPKDWGPKFNMGTTPSTNSSDYPPIAELRAAFKNVYADLTRIAPKLPADLLASPCPFELVRDRFPTFGSFLTWMMTGHLGYHLGQLSEWKAPRSTRRGPGA